MKKFDKVITNLLNINENLLKILEQLEKFQYGCLYSDGKIITDQNEMNNRPAETLIIQTPEMFLQNKIGMCHDASVYIDKVCIDNKIKHKCIYMSSNVPPEYKTHSFVVIETNDKKWQVIDVFATNNCLWKLPFNTAKEAIDARIHEWILKDIKGKPDIETYLGFNFPEAGCNFIEFYHRLIKVFGRYYTKHEMSDIYYHNSKLLEEEYNANFKGCMLEHPNRSFTTSDDVICESNYFDTVPQQLEDYLIEFINEQIKLHNYYIEIPISKIAQILLQNKIANYKCFHNFLNTLVKNTNGYLNFKFCSEKEQSYFQPPIEISKIKIISSEKEPENISINKMGLIMWDYNDWIRAKLANEKTMNDVYKKINNEILYRDDWGEIAIAASYFGENKKYLLGVLDHEFGHFLTFLIRVSGENHNLCRYWSHYHHEDFKLNERYELPEDQKAAYLLDSDEFKNWCTTIVQRLVNDFKDNSEDFSEEVIVDFYNYFIEHEIKHNYRYLPKYDNNQDILTKSFRYDDALLFLRVIYQDSLYERNNNHNRNNFTVFKKWLWRELKKLINKKGI